MVLEQKGTVGNKPFRKDLPFSPRGLIPHLIINPNCIPKRMTIGQLIETLLAKVCVATGTMGDGTPFEQVSIEELNNQLIKAGYEAYGNETMYNGMTGQKIETPIFFGPIYYQRLKHMVDDKVHARDFGPQQILTRQPTEGKRSALANLNRFC